ncbi:MAG: hypothetical protein M1546_14865 [Chloroflexi bacterium]|nr:hypothetical protein [Chloroflexota bacterium]
MDADIQTHRRSETRFLRAVRSAEIGFLAPHLKQFRREAESGFTVTIQAIYYTVLLFIFFALIFDFGNAGFVFTVASNATRLAAQDAAKNIDEEAFINDQEIRLQSDALTRAQEMVTGLAGDRVTVTNVTISRLEQRDVIVVQAIALANMPVLGNMFGLSSVSFPVEAFAEPAYGISEEGQ